MISVSNLAKSFGQQTLFENACATLFPICWAEPFGRVMIESMACGTPVIGNIRVGSVFCGSVEEVIEDGVSGFHVDATDPDDAIAKAVLAAARISELDRRVVRQIFDRDWNSVRVAREIDAAYRRYRSVWNYQPAYTSARYRVSKRLLRAMELEKDA